MSDLDNEELKATRELNRKEIEKSSSIEEKQEKSSCIEKTADEMFKDENYIKEFYDKMGDSTIEEKCEVLVYRYYISKEEIETQIEFYLEDEEVGINGLLNKRILKAINKKCKELGWIE